jgi:hypothetical protein
MKPDGVFFSTKSKRWIIVQNKLSKLYVQGLKTAVDTTDIQKIYLNRDGNVLKGFQEIRERALQELKKYPIERVVVCSEDTHSVPGVVVIAPNKSNTGDRKSARSSFFELIFEKDGKTLQPEIWPALEHYLKLMRKGARKKRIAESSAEGMSAKDK